MHAPDNPADYRTIWDRKPALRMVYEDIYRRMAAARVPGRTLEIGGGSGNFKLFAPDTVTTDILPAPWLDAVCDAQRLPFVDGSFSNIAMVDVLHHIESPLVFMREAVRVLHPGGRLIVCEPAITPLSGIFYRHFHPEPVDMSADPLRSETVSTGKDPYDSNQAVPTLLTGRFREQLARAVPELHLTGVERLSFIAYPLSGGFRSWSLLPLRLAAPLLAAEWRLRKILGAVAAFRLLAIYNRI